MKGPPLGPGVEDITWPDQVALRGRRTPSTRKVKPQTSHLRKHACQGLEGFSFHKVWILVTFSGTQFWIAHGESLHRAHSAR